MARDDPVKLSDPKAIRALAHPARLTVIEELYSGRELTATEAAEIAGISPSAMSYHLRSLQKSGIVERADTSADGRERPWRAAGSSLQVDSDSRVAESAALTSTILVRLGERFRAWLANRGAEPRRWQDASVMGSGQVWLTVEELEEFGNSIDEFVARFRGRAQDRPADARRVYFSLFAFPADKPPGAAP